MKKYENANVISYQNKILWWQEIKNTYCFSYYEINNNLELFIEKDITHDDLYDISINDTPYQINNKNEEGYWGRGPYSGRLFVDQKVITFWRFPESQQKLKKISDDIFKKINIDIYKEKYKIEIITDQKTKDDAYLNQWGSAWGNSNSTALSTELIPVEKYEKSFKINKTDLKIPHLMNPTQKKKWLKSVDYKPKYSKWKKWMKPFEKFNN
jgi:hypothetical protein